MENPRRIYRQFRFAVRWWGISWLLAPLALMFREQIISTFGEWTANILLFVSGTGIFAGFIVMLFLHHYWQGEVQNRTWQREDFMFLVEAHLDRTMPSLHSGGAATAHSNASSPPDESKSKVATTLWQMLWKLDDEAIRGMPQEERNALLRLLKSDDVRIVKRILELVEQALLIEALPLVRRLVDGRLRASGDVYNTPVAERVLSCLEAQYAAQQQQQYLRPSAAPNAELLLPASHTPQQADNLLRPTEQKP